MANTKTIKKTAPVAEESAVTPVTETNIESKAESPKKKPVAKEIDLHDMVTVRNGFQGRLVYISKKTGERFVWEEFGDEQDMEIGELRSARSSSKAFFENNWFMFDDQWVVDYLGMNKYYKYALRVEDFDDVFTKDPEEIVEIVNDMTKGQKKSMAYRARALIAEGEIDSNKVIATLEKCLNTQLVER